MKNGLTGGVTMVTFIYILLLGFMPGPNYLYVEFLYLSIHKLNIIILFYFQ